MNEIFHHAATFEFALHAYNLVAVINQHTKVINKWLNRMLPTVLLINIRFYFFFLTTMAISPKQIVLNAFAIGEF